MKVEKGEQLMDLKNDGQAMEKLSDQFAEFVDLTDEDLEEIDVLELGDVHGGQCRQCGYDCGHRDCGHRDCRHRDCRHRDCRHRDCRHR